jgi:4-amino-4-deoxy-L-arabinose transferase-like glycosyltransferase
MKETIRKNRGIICVCGIYFVISLVLFMVMTGGKAMVQPDSPSYIGPAKQIVENAFFSQDGINPEYRRTPGYPLFLAVIYFLGGNDTIVGIVQILLVALALFLFYRTIVMLNIPPNLALLGTMLLLFDMRLHWYSFIIMTEALFCFFIILSLYFLVKYLHQGKKYRLFFAFAAAFNYALLVRPILMYFNMLVCTAFFIGFLVKKISWRCFVLFAFCFVLVFGGWSYRNYIHSGVFIFSTIQNHNMQRYYAPFLSKYIQTSSYGDDDIKEYQDYHNKVFLQEYQEVVGGNLNQAQIHVLEGKYGARFIKAHLPEYIKINIVGLLKMMFRSFGDSRIFQFKIRPLSVKTIAIRIIQWLDMAYILVIYLLYVLGLYTAFRKRDALQISIFLLCGYLAAASAIFGNMRFRYPFFPLLVLGAVISGRFVIQWVLSKSASPLLNRIGRFLLVEEKSPGGPFGKI